MCSLPTAIVGLRPRLSKTSSLAEKSRRFIPSEEWLCGQVAERSMAAGCKPAAPCELRGFESSPVHHVRNSKWKLEDRFRGWESRELPVSIFEFQSRDAGVTQW